MKCIGSNIKKLIGSIITDKATENVKIMTHCDCHCDCFISDKKGIKIAYNTKD